MSRTSNVVMRQRRMRVLELLQESALRGDGALATSHRELADKVGMTVGQSRSLLRLLCNEGLVESRYRYLPNGGQLGNDYRITARGASVLAESETR